MNTPTPLGLSWWFACLLFVFLLGLGHQGLASQDIKDRPAASLVSATSTWTAYSWLSGAWKESILAKTVKETFDEQGRLLSSSTALDTGLVVENVSYHYEKDQLMRIIWSDAEQNVTLIASYQFSSAGVSILTRLASGSLLESEILAELGADNWQSSSVYGSDGVLQKTRNLKFASQDVPLEELVYAPNGSLIYSQGHNYLEHDLQGNWTIRQDTESLAGRFKRPVYMIRRKLIYAKDL